MAFAELRDPLFWPSSGLQMVGMSMVNTGIINDLALGQLVAGPIGVDGKPVESVTFNFMGLERFGLVNPEVQVSPNGALPGG